MTTQPDGVAGDDGQPALAGLEQLRAGLYAELAATGDFRPGSVTENFRRCGKANCACAGPDHPGHGPRYLLTWSVAGRTQGRQLSPGLQLERVRREVANYQRFVALSQQVVEVNEAICDARGIGAVGDGEPTVPTRAEKGGSRAGSRRRAPPR